MIKTIIKRDGTRVPFDADKLNRWGQWAATNLNRYVDWSMVVRETAKRSSETVKSSDLQETLIKVCLEQESYSYNKMAGRLYCGNWRKQLFKKDDIPTIKQVQERLYRAGLMKKLAYSDDEYAELETVINHDLDLQSSYSELQFSRQKYCLQNRVTKAEYETPQFMYMRMAMALFEDFPDRMVHVKKMYAMLSQKKVSAPTPAYVHLGTRMSGFSSCCLFKSGDSIQSLAAHDHIAYMMTSMGAGLGSMLDTRTAGDKVRGGAIKHMGKLPYLRALETSTHANRQCYAEGTDILTDRGFVNFKDVTKEMRVAQVDNQHRISFVTPQAIQQYDVNDGEMIQFLSSKGGPGWLGVYHPFMLVTPEHRMMAHVYDALRGYATEEYIPILAKDYPIRATNRIMDVGAYVNGEHDEFTDLDRLWAIYQTRYGVYTGNSVRDFRFYGNDETEADFLTMLKRMHARFNIEPSNEGKSRIIHVYDQRHLSKGGFPFSLSDRTASWCEQCVSFMTDLTHTGRHRSVYKNLELVRQLQSLAACANLRTTASLMPEYVEPRLKLQLMFGKSNAFRMRIKTESIQYTGKVYCVTVPEGRVVVRYNGRTCVSGNSGRGGSATSYFNCFDPEAETICNLKNPLSTDAHRIRGLDYGFSYNRFFARKAADDKDVFTFTSYSAPDLFSAFYSGDPQKFADLYAKYEADAGFKKTYISARKLLTVALQQAYETGRIYQFNADEANRHTPFKDPIYQSNLCTEVFEPTEAYEHVSDLYNGGESSKGEVALCSLAAINLGNVTDAEYEEVAYYALLLIDRCILMNDYPLPQVGIKAKARMSAGVSMIDLAHYLAKNHVSYSSPEGKALIHRVAERHSYNVIKASLRLGKELGNAPWMNRTKWPDGWLPIDTYNKSVDKMTAEPLHYDWEGLRKEIVANGGIRNSVTQVSVPAESSSVAVGATNGLYPIRSWTLIKTNADNTTYWAAPDSDRLHNAYEIAWDVPTKDLIEMYAIVQKFMDQGISADLYRKLLKDDTIGTSEMLTTFFLTMPLKSRYYMNIRTTEIKEEPETQGCESGACTL